jgi:polyadenylate-binding protein
LDLLNYSLIKNKPCRIMMSQRDPALRKTGTGNIFLKNLVGFPAQSFHRKVDRLAQDETIDNKALHDTFAAFGDILSCKVQLDEHGVSKGYGFVHFTTNEAADDAIQAVNGMLLNDKVVYVGHHVPKRERQQKIDEVRSRFTNLYVKNLSPDVDQAEFEDLFKKFGAVTSAVLQVDAEGKSKGFGFVQYADHEAARAAVDALHEREHKGLQLFVSRAQKKGEREEELRKNYEAQKYEKNLKYQGVNLYVKNLDDDMSVAFAFCFFQS